MAVIKSKSCDYRWKGTDNCPWMGGTDHFADSLWYYSACQLNSDNFSTLNLGNHGSHLSTHHTLSPSPPEAACQHHRVSIYLSNCWNLLPKTDKLRHLCHQGAPGIVALCKTWLDKNIQQVKEDTQCTASRLHGRMANLSA